MNRIAQVFPAAAVCVVLAGCGETTGVGAAITSTVVDKDSGRSSLVTLYGHSGANDEIAFAIFTNISSDAAVSSIAGSWWGNIRMEGDSGAPILAFAGAPEAIEINGARYNYSVGRVFSAGALAVTQIEAPIQDADGEDEIDRLSKLQEIQDFLKN